MTVPQKGHFWISVFPSSQRKFSDLETVTAFTGPHLLCRPVLGGGILSPPSWSPVVVTRSGNRSRQDPYPRTHTTVPVIPPLFSRSYPVLTVLQMVLSGGVSRPPFTYPLHPFGSGSRPSLHHPGLRSLTVTPHSSPSVGSTKPPFP